MAENQIPPNNTYPIEITTEQTDEGLSKEDRVRLIISGIIGLLVLALLVVGAVFLLQQDPTDTGHIRDIFIIFIALEVFVVGFALIILIIQLATLINLLQNEIKPIIETTKETANTVRGTATFISNNLSEPIILLNQYLAAFKKLFDLVKPGK